MAGIQEVYDLVVKGKAKTYNISSVETLEAYRD